jgi:hypothetical protein
LPIHNPCFSEILIIVRVFESGEQRTKDDVAVMKIIKEMQHRSFSPELGDGWRRRWRMRPVEQRTEP